MVLTSLGKVQLLEELLPVFLVVSTECKNNRKRALPLEVWNDVIQKVVETTYEYPPPLSNKLWTKGKISTSRSKMSIGFRGWSPFEASIVTTMVR